MVQRRVLILLAHPALHRSRINLAMLEAIQDLPQVTVRDLYEEYPEYHIEVSEEQRLLTEHEVYVWQHPFYWYSAPALLKEWMDVVLEYGFAYGEGGTALRGRKILNALTTGGTEGDYQRGGDNHFTMAELLAPMTQTARLCGMEYLDPFILHGVGRFSNAEITAGAERYRKHIQALCEGRLA